MNFSSSSSNSSPVVRDDLKNAIFKNIIIVTLCLFINYINATLLYTFTKHEIFKMNPRYILFIHLVINDIILLTLLTLMYILSYTIYIYNVSLCILLILIGSSSNFNNPMTLALMAIECYVAVCFPLRHSQIITVKKTYIVIVFIWLISALYLLPDVFIALAKEPLDFFYSKIFCTRPNIFRHSQVAEKDIIFNAVFMVIIWSTLFYTYLQIVFTAKSASAGARKARNTVLLHSFQLSLSMLTYLYFVIYYELTALFPESASAIRFAMMIFINIIPRLVSPLVYGIRDKTFRKYFTQHLFCGKAFH
ncbi:odorant receptor 131-2-like [Periophthalmus magnuspinnatus]|nr:odorant receptor 131-2-like [Periophthalmus magnuspinnatus]